MRPPRPSPKPFRRAARWLGGLAFVIAAPKCFLCAAAYFGLGALLGLGQPELCGAPPARSNAVTSLSSSAP